MFGLTPYENKHSSVSAYNPFRDLANFERSFFGENELAEFKTDIKDMGDHYQLEADLPGFKKEDINVDIDGDYMTISGERHSEFEEKDKKGNYVRCERSYGSYSRSFDLSNVRTDDISAEYKDGVLKMKLPKRKEETPAVKRLEIK